jgi:hypothetical protein
MSKDFFGKLTKSDELKARIPKSIATAISSRLGFETDLWDNDASIAFSSCSKFQRAVRSDAFS